MHRRPVVPQDCVADPPLVSIDEALARREVEQLVNERIAILARHPDDHRVGGAADVERAGAGFGMGAHQRVLDVGGARLLLVGEGRTVRVGDRIGADSAVVDYKPVDACPRCFGQCSVDRASAREEGVGAGARNLLRVQHRPHARALQELRIGVPDPLDPRPHRLALVVLEIRDDETACRSPGGCTGAG